MPGKKSPYEIELTGRIATLSARLKKEEAQVELTTAVRAELEGCLTKCRAKSARRSKPKADMQKQETT